MKIVVCCPSCCRRVLDKITPTSGVIRLKCPHCGRIVLLDLSLRGEVRYRAAVRPAGTTEEGNDPK
ncbi:MAG: hypothetical protein IIZ66_08410 [Clostridia bacterium]|nr:hypothetical protein [Clostridia bacterium]